LAQTRYGKNGRTSSAIALNIGFQVRKDKLEAISGARVAAKFHLDLMALTAKIAADRNSNLGVKPQ
jgi:hypothetical protein